MLLQSVDRVAEPGDDPANWQLKAGPAADPAQLADLAFAWKACRAVKSNAILLASGGASVGVGMGQVNRVDSARLAVMRAGDRAAGSVAASDAYFPFADGFEILAEAGVRAVAEPGGSIRDHLTVTAAAGRRGQPVLHRRPALLPLTFLEGTPPETPRPRGAARPPYPPAPGGPCRLRAAPGRARSSPRRATARRPGSTGRR